MPSIDASVVAGDMVLGATVVVVVVVDLVGLNAFGLSSVIRISSGLVISLILIPSGFSFANCRFLSFFDKSLLIVVVDNEMITSFLDVDLFASDSFAVNLESSAHETNEWQISIFDFCC